MSETISTNDTIERLICLDDDEDDSTDIEPLDMPPHFIACQLHEKFFPFRQYKLQIRYGMASEEQKRAIFPKRRSPDEVITASNFASIKCFELFADGKLTGLCHVKVYGFCMDEQLCLYASLEAVYLKPRSRKKGMLHPFMQITGDSVSRELMTHIIQFSQAGKTKFEVTVQADLYSEGGQSAICLLGMHIESLLDSACELTCLDIVTVILDDQW